MSEYAPEATLVFQWQHDGEIDQLIVGGGGREVTKGLDLGGGRKMRLLLKQKNVHCVAILAIVRIVR